jgi:GTPase
VFIDTAGLRRKNKIKEEIERYSIIRTVSAVERCNVAVLVIDATEGITDQDTKIAGIAHERGKGMIIAVNKWDAIEKNDKTMKKFTEDVREKLSYMPYAELLFISAETGQRLPKLFETIDMVIENHSLRVATGVLNEIMAEAVALNQPPSDKGKRLRLYYITQVSVKRFAIPQPSYHREKSAHPPSQSGLEGITPLPDPCPVTASRYPVRSEVLSP